MSNQHFDTNAVHAGQQPDPSTGALTTPVIRSAPFVFGSLAAMDAYAAGDLTCFEYGRTANPTVRAVERKMAVLEGADDAVASSSGMAALSTTLLALLRTGDRMLVADDGYRRSLGFIRDSLPRWGIQGDWVPVDDLVDNVAAELDARTRLVMVEAPTNPHLRLPSLSDLAEVCHRAGALLVVDATLASPALLRPLEHGADLVLHSATKYLAGHNDLLAGVVAGRQELIDEVRALHLNLGATLDADPAFLLLRGLKTLSLRVKHSSATALDLARWLEAQPGVRAVYYPGLESNPDHASARGQMSAYGAVLSIELDADLDGVGRFVDALQVIYLGTSLGGVESLALHLGVMMRHGLTREDRDRLGLTDQLVRLSIGLEDVDDLRADLARGLRQL